MNRTWKLLLTLLAVALLGLGAFVATRVAADSVRPQEIAENGFQAKLFVKSSVAKQVAVIVIGGGPAGDYWASEFAQAGCVGLSLPYTRLAGLPPRPEEIPVEYFAKAIDWFAKRPEVDPEKIILLGASRNAELTLVIASTLPEFVSGAIAFAPSAIHWSNTVLPYNSDEIKPSWTYQGEAIPYLPMEKIKGPEGSKLATLPYWQSGLAQVEQFPEALIPVEKINGPILLLSGEDDKVWPATTMSDMIEARLKANDFPYSLKNIQYPNAGHLISRNLATIEYGRTSQLQIGNQSYEIEFGGTVEGDSEAIKDAKNQIMDFVINFKK
ncbi:MAG: acyl-CoA thioester hydrolase/BAAT C-terminal domain-containing protein [Bacteroidota bacterium]